MRVSGRGTDDAPRGRPLPHRRSPPPLLAPRGLRGGRPGRAAGPRCGRAAGHGAGVTRVSAGTRHTAPPKKGKVHAGYFLPLQVANPAWAAATRAADAARAADSRPRHTRTSGSRIPRLFSLNPAVPTPQCTTLSAGLLCWSYSLTAPSGAKQYFYIR